MNSKKILSKRNLSNSDDTTNQINQHTDNSIKAFLISKSVATEDILITKFSQKVTVLTNWLSKYKIVLVKEKVHFGILTLLLFEWKKDPIQYDSFNCGVFACYFLKFLVQDKKIDFKSNENDLFNLRLEINNLIKQFSNKNFCSYCGNNIYANELTLKTDCLHLYHLSCLESTENDLFFCPLCF